MRVLRGLLGLGMLVAGAVSLPLPLGRSFPLKRRHPTGWALPDERSLYLLILGVGLPARPGAHHRLRSRTGANLLVAPNARSGLPSDVSHANSKLLRLDVR